MFDLSLLPNLLFATWQTIAMVIIASLIGISAGLAIGVALFLSKHKQLNHQPLIYQPLGFIVNVGRSVPFIILLIALIPFTRLLVGSSIGTAAAIVPLTIAAIPFYARIAEAAFEEVPRGLIETSRAMGATRWQFIRHMLLPEATPSLIKGATLTVIGIIGYSAMAGAVGGGGLGELAINYGYQRFNIAIMLETVAILVLLVQCVQWLGDTLSHPKGIRWTCLASIMIVLGGFCVQGAIATSAATTLLRVGVISGPSETIMATAKKVAKERYHLTLKIIPFDDYIIPNTALADGQLDANIFQHTPYLNTQIHAHHYALTPLAKTFVYPMGFFSTRIHDIKQLRTGALIAIPNDPSNEGRSLLLLQQAGLITLQSSAGLLATTRDISSNPRQLRFKLIPAAQCPRALPDVDMAALTNDFVAPAGLQLTQAIIKENKDVPYANVIAIQTKDKDNPALQDLVSVMHSSAVVKKTQSIYPDGGAIAAW